MAEPVRKDGVTLGPSSSEVEFTSRNETPFSDSIPSENKVEVATEDESSSGRRTRSAEARRKFVNGFSNDMYMDT